MNSEFTFSTSQLLKVMEIRIDHFCATAVLLLLFLPVIVQPQILEERSSTTRAGINTVAGMVYAPNGTPAGRAIFVRLSKAGSDATAWTDDDGKFLIGGMSSGIYTVTVEAGDDFEPASQRLEIAQSSGGPQTFHVIVQLRRKSAGTREPGVVDAGAIHAPKKAVEYYRNGVNAAAKRDHEGAVNEFLKAVAEYPEFLLAHSELGVQYQNLNQLDKADAHLTLALKIKPDAYEPLANRGVVLVRLGKLEESEAVLRSAIKIRDDSAVVRFYLGRALLGMKKSDQAEAEFRAALEKGSNEARRSLANIYLQRGEDRKALVELEAYLQANPNPADEKKLRGTIQQIKDQLKETPKP